MNARTARISAKAGLAATVAAVLLTSACGNKVGGSKPAAGSTGGSGGSGGSAGTAASGTDALLTAAKAEGEVDYYEAWGDGEPQNKIFKAAADDFTAKTGIKVNIKVLGRAGVKTLSADIASGAATPDLIDSGTDHIASDEALKVPAHLDDITKLPVPGEAGKTVGDVLPANVLKSATDKDGHLVFVPHTVISTALWYDAARFPDVAANPPKTWTEFIALLDKEKAAGKTPIAQDGLANFYNVYWFYWAMMRHGGPGTLSALATDAAAWDKPETLAAAKDIAQLAKGGYLQDGYMGTKYPAGQNDWAQGKAALNLNGTWLPAETHPQAPADAKPGSFQFPTVDGGHASVEVGSLGWSLSAKAKHPNAAKLFLSYMVQKSVIAKIGTEALNIPSRPDTPAPEALKQAQDAIVAAKETNATYDGATANSKWWNDVLLPLDDQLFGGKITPEEFVAQGKKKTADALANG